MEKVFSFSMKARLSVIIVTYRSEKHIGPCLDALSAANDIGTELEVVVVDNETTGAAQRRKVLEENYSSLSLRCICNIRNGGYGQGNNVGIRHASAPVVLIMNPDVRLTGATPGQIRRAFDDDQSLVLLGMRQWLGSGKPGRSFLWSEGLPPSWFGSALVAWSNRFGTYCPRWECIQGSCFALRKSAFEAAGLFDETVFMYGEERDIHHRLRAGGGKIACDWNLSYRHLTDQRESSISSCIRQWQVRRDWCKRHGIPPIRFWKALRSQIRWTLWIASVKALGKETPKIRFLREKMAALSTCEREDDVL